MEFYWHGNWGLLVVNTAALAYVSRFAVSGVACLAAVPRARTFETPAVRRGLGGCS